MTLGALLILLAAAPAAAQSSPSCTTISLSHTVPDLFEPGASQSVEVHVTNEAPYAEARVNVRTSIAGEWTIEPETADVNVAAEATETVTFTVTAANVHDEAVQLRLVADGACGPPGQVNLDDVLRTNEATDTVVLETVPAPAFRFPDLTEIPAEYALGGIGAAVIAGGAVLALRRRGAGFDVRAVEPEKMVRAGRGTSFPVEVRNRGREQRTAEFTVSDPPEGWNAFLAVPELTLNADEARTVWLMVRAPRDATPASAAILTVMVRPKGDGKHASRIAVRAEVTDAEPAGDDGDDRTTIG